MLFFFFFFVSTEDQGVLDWKYLRGQKPKWSSRTCQLDSSWDRDSSNAQVSLYTTFSFIYLYAVTTFLIYAMLRLICFICVDSTTWCQAQVFIPSPRVKGRPQPCCSLELKGESQFRGPSVLRV